MNDKKISENRKSLNFRDYFNALNERSPKAELRDDIISSLGISRESFYRKLRENSFNKLEQEAIAYKLGISVFILFPEEVSC